ncbi:MAG: hypothetical protein GQ574_19670 [Crocinitomix sp.]|nr:hypothetical protein [Crocinitomix sp.]
MNTQYNYNKYYYLQDVEGYFINNLSIDVIQINLRSCIDIIQESILSFCSNINIHSIYLRGSIARGIIYPQYSDIDIIIIGLPNSQIDINSLRPFLNNVVNKKNLPFQKVDIYLQNRDEIFPSTAFSIKVSSICLYGTSLAESLPKYKADNSVCFTIKSLESNIDIAINDLGKIMSLPKEFQNKKGVSSIYNWIAKKLLRSGMELTIPIQKKYTRNLYCCYTLFAETFPEEASKMKKILDFFINKETNCEILIAAINKIEKFIICQIISKNNYNATI